MAEPTRPETPNLNQTTIPTYDEKSPFNADSHYQASTSTSYQITTNNKKRLLYSSPSGSPIITSATDILQALTNEADPEKSGSSRF